MYSFHQLICLTIDLQKDFNLSILLKGTIILIWLNRQTTISDSHFLILLFSEN